jgi:hypothetical protein
MRRSVLSLATLVAVVVLVCGSMFIAAEERGTKRDADQFKQKMDAISAFGVGRSKQSLRTTVTEKELNAYFVFDAQTALPAGVIDPSVSLVGDGRVAARATVDLDAVGKAKGPRGALDPLAYLTGKLPITVAGVLRTTNGIARLDVESATVGGVPIPKILLQEIVSYYSRSSEKPSGVGLDEGFPLPSRIREIQVQPRQAIIIQ